MAKTPVPYGAATRLVWLAMLFAPLNLVMGRSGTPSEDWPGAARFISAARCEGGDVFTNVGPGVKFGIGYYDRTLLGVARKVQQRDEAFQTALARASPSRQDMAVVLAHASGADSPNVRGLGMMRAWFVEDGWTERSFGTQLLVYYRETCPPAATP